LASWYLLAFMVYMCQKS